MPDPLLYLKAMGAAAIVSAIFLLTMVAVRRTANAVWLNSACVPAIGLGLAAGCYVMSLRISWPPMNGLDRFLTIVVPAALAIELVAGFDRVPVRAGWLLRLCLAAATPRILLHGSVYISGADSDWPMWKGYLVMAVCGTMLAGLWALMCWLSRRSPGTSIPIALQMATLCAGATVMMAGYIKGGAAALPMVATLVATTFAVALVSRRTVPVAKPDTPALISVGVVGLSGLLLIGRFFGQLSTASALAMLLAPLLCWTTEARPLRNRKSWIVGTLRLVLVAIPLVTVFVLAKRDFDRDMAPLLIRTEGPASGPDRAVLRKSVVPFSLARAGFR